MTAGKDLFNVSQITLTIIGGDSDEKEDETYGFVSILILRDRLRCHSIFWYMLHRYTVSQLRSEWIRLSELEHTRYGYRKHPLMQRVFYFLKGGKMVNLTELDKLEEYLKENDISYERIDRIGEFWNDWHQLVVRGPKDYRWDVICHHGSYGYKEGLLETMGDIVNEKEVGDRVEGWLTAEDVINRIEEMVMGDNDENGTV